MLCFFFFNFIYLFGFGYAGSSLLHRLSSSCSKQGVSSSSSVRASHPGGFSCCGTQALGYMGSVAVAPRF